MTHHAITSFVQQWTWESESTHKTLDRLTDASLAQESHPGGRTIGRLAWHIAQTLPEMMGKAGLQLSGPSEHDAVPTTAKAIADAYRVASASLLEQLQMHWTDASLAVTDDMYGERWTRAQTLSALVGHQTHHRGQLTVPMRQAGLAVPGIYGPAKEEWAQMGMDVPEI